MRSLCTLATGALLACCARAPQPDSSERAYLEYSRVARASEIGSPHVQCFPLGLEGDRGGEPIPVAVPLRRAEIALVRRAEDAVGLPGFFFEVASEDAAEFETFTGQIVGQQLAVFVGGNLVTVPTVQSALPGSATLTGDWTEREYEELAAILRADASR